MTGIHATPKVSAIRRWATRATPAPEMSRVILLGSSADGRSPPHPSAARPPPAPTPYSPALPSPPPCPPIPPPSPPLLRVPALSPLVRHWATTTARSSARRPPIPRRRSRPLRLQPRHLEVSRPRPRPRLRPSAACGVSNTPVLKLGVD